jgi:ring-1,2-phenylacetyl-CoA epoxidase subunit PaaD
MDVITMNIRMTLSILGFKNIKITQALSPAWTTDWMSEEGKQKLKDYALHRLLPSSRFAMKRLFAEEAIQWSAL